MNDKKVIWKCRHCEHSLTSYRALRAGCHVHRCPAREGQLTEDFAAERMRAALIVSALVGATL